MILLNYVVEMFVLKVITGDIAVSVLTNKDSKIGIEKSQG